LNQEHLPELIALQKHTLEQLQSTTKKLQTFNTESVEQYKTEAMDFKQAVKKLKGAREDLDTIFKNPNLRYPLFISVTPILLSKYVFFNFRPFGDFAKTPFSNSDNVFSNSAHLLFLSGSPSFQKQPPKLNVRPPRVCLSPFFYPQKKGKGKELQNSQSLQERC
jgi:hypothetical protein